MRVLTHNDVLACLAMPECIEAMALALADLARGGYHQPLRTRAMTATGKNRMVLMPALRLTGKPLWGLKEIVVTPANPTLHGLDSHQGVLLLHDGVTGVLQAIVEASAITSIRTAAVSAVATRALARPDARRVTLLGSGIQAEAHVAAMRAALPAAALTVWSRNPNHAAHFAHKHGCLAERELEAAVRGAEVLCTVTSATEPFVRLEWLAPGCHVNAVGSSVPTVRELDAATVAACSLFVDRRESALAEAGEIVKAIEEGAIDASHLKAELGQVLAGQHPGRSSTSERTLFKSLGLALEDVVAAEAAWRMAERIGRGTLVEGW